MINNNIYICLQRSSISPGEKYIRPRSPQESHHGHHTQNHHDHPIHIKKMKKEQDKDLIHVRVFFFFFVNKNNFVFNNSVFFFAYSLIFILKKLQSIKNFLKPANVRILNVRKKKKLRVLAVV